MRMTKTLMASVMGLAAGGAIVPMVAGADGIARNQAAIAMATQATPCTPQASKTPALRQQCALRAGSRALQDETTAGGPGAVTYVVGGAAILAVGAGVVAAVDDDDNDPADAFPISS